MGGVACLVGLFGTLHYWLVSCDKDILPDADVSPTTSTEATVSVVTAATNLTGSSNATDEVIPDVIAITDATISSTAVQSVEPECLNHGYCYITIACIFAYSFVPIIFGIIGSNRASKMPRFAIIMYHIQVHLNCSLSRLIT